MNRARRFTVSERAVHWLLALAFFSLLVSGLVVGRRGTFHDVMYAWHLVSAGVLVGGVMLIVVAGNRRALRRTARELGSLDVEDREWLGAIPARLRSGSPKPPAARFNAGQKVNFTLVCILLAALYITGVRHDPRRHPSQSGLRWSQARDDRPLRLGRGSSLHGARQPRNTTRAARNADRRRRSRVGAQALPALEALAERALERAGEP